MRPLVVVSRADSASLNIRDALLDLAPWEDAGLFRGLPVRRHERFLLVEVDPMHLACDLVDRELKEAGLAFDTMLFASRHRAESGKPALTVHPLGNFGNADFGGHAGRLCPTDPVVMGRVLRALFAEAKGLKHQVTFEATHHGPYLETPAMFVEIGTDESAWGDPDLGRRVARAILAAATPAPGDDAPALVQLGGSHYAPKATDLARQGRANFGHIVPGYAIERGLEARVVLDLIRLTPGCRGYHMDAKLIASPPQDVVQAFAGLELGWWTENDL